jgi:hypothetical protein
MHPAANLLPCNEDYAMLITFKTQAHAHVTMFGDAALQLISMMGRDETVPSAISADDVAQALSLLHAALAAKSGDLSAPDTDQQSRATSDGAYDQPDPAVSIRIRSMPLIELLEAATQAGSPVMWEEDVSAF